MTTKKREYEKPSMRVFDLKQKPSLLAGSVTATRTSYGSPTEETWD